MISYVIEICKTGPFMAWNTKPVLIRVKLGWISFTKFNVSLRIESKLIKTRAEISQIGHDLA